MNIVSSKSSLAVTGEYDQVITAVLHVVSSEILLKLNAGVAIGGWAADTPEAR
jgi:hypothetical protein